YLVSVAGPFIFWLGVFSILAGFFYTASPAALAYIGLGEITVFIFMGPVIVLGTYYVQAQQVSWPVVLLSLPIGFLVAAILHANNLRDIEGDRAIGKRTLASILGRHSAVIEYAVLLGGSYLFLALIIAMGIAPLWTIIAFLTLPTAISLAGRAASTVDTKILNGVLRRTAQLHTNFGLLMIAGFVIGLFVK
ncbi:MAG: 1,4-dihydroxy-2-naphthoate octaprenyltransferase, partial [Chloroflexi bacterium]|nr:1,4-dihydroxy-2-naphthoate octaprenyltransferase [Chloroflexota bacterium]